MSTRRVFLKSTALTATPLFVPACARTRPMPSGESNVLDDLSHQLLTAYPETASSAGLDTGKYAELKSRLTDRSAQGQASIQREVRAMRTRLRDLDSVGRSRKDALDLDVVGSVYDLAIEGFEFPYGDVALLNSNWSYRNSPYVVAQNTGAFVEIPQFLESAHLIASKADAEAYLQRMQAYAQQLDGETERVRLDGERGVILPDFLIAKTLKQMRTQLAAEVSKWGIVSTFQTRTAKLELPNAELAAQIAEQQIAPAIQRQLAALEKLAPRARSEAGVRSLPDGEAYYAWALKAGTTTTLSPREVHEIGLSELDALHARMDPILRAIGYTSGSVGARMAALGNDPRYQFSEGDEGRKEILLFIEDRLADIRRRMPQAFETLVPGFLEVTRIPEEVEAGAPGAYGGAGSIDGTQPGHFWINLRTPDLHRRYSLPDLTYHEAIPGHVWQGEYAFKQPLTRSLLAFNAYSEGWALYAEQLADELGVYDDFPVGRLGYLQSLAFRACRLVVDTGLHAQGWTREQAVNFFVERNGSNPPEVAGEVDRYCAWPGQACGYKVGHTAIVRLREKARTELGARFDLRKFNDAVVLGGSVPMTVLGRVIDQHIARARAAG